jgi:hypothetical protein
MALQTGLVYQQPRQQQLFCYLLLAHLLLPLNCGLGDQMATRLPNHVFVGIHS